jgi:arylformamidase
MRGTLAFLLVATTTCGAEAQVHRDRAYAEPKNERQTLDLYAPTEGKDHPVVFWIHGGGWQAGDKTAITTARQGVAGGGCISESRSRRGHDPWNDQLRFGHHG